MVLNLVVLAISLWMLALVALWFAHPPWRVWIEQPKHRILDAPMTEHARQETSIRSPKHGRTTVPKPVDEPPRVFE